MKERERMVRQYFGMAVTKPLKIKLAKNETWEKNQNEKCHKMI